MQAMTIRRGLTVAAVTVTAALAAAGCGSGGSGAASAASDAKALDYVPKSALMYATFDTDVAGKNWKQVDKLISAVDPDYDGIVKEINEAAKKDDDFKNLDFSKDVDPWLGASGGFALTDLNKASSDSSDDVTQGVLAWVDIEDRSAFEDFLKKYADDAKKDGTIGDFTVWTKAKSSSSDSVAGDEAVIGVSDDLALIAGTKAELKTYINTKDSVLDDKGAKRAADELTGDSIFAVVVSGNGIRKALDDDASRKSASKIKQIQKLDGATFSVEATDKGFHGQAWIGYDGLKVNTNTIDPKLFKSLPVDTVAAFGGQDLGGGIKSLIDGLESGNDQVGTIVAQGEAFLGIDREKLAKGLSGEFSLGFSGSDTELKKVAGSSTSPGGAVAAATQGTLALVFEDKDGTQNVLTSLAKAGATLTGAPPTKGKVGSFETSELALGGMTLYVAHNSDVDIVTTSKAFLETYGSGDTLGDNSGFKDAWDDAGAPDKVTASLFVDAQRLAKLANGGDSKLNYDNLGSFIGWGSADKDATKFDMFLSIDD